MRRGDDRAAVAEPAADRRHVEADEVVRERIGIQMGTIGPYPGISLRCRHCKVVLSVMPDPDALKEEVVQEVLKALDAPDKRKKR